MATVFFLTLIGCGVFWVIRKLNGLGVNEGVVTRDGFNPYAEYAEAEYAEKEETASLNIKTLKDRIDALTEKCDWYSNFALQDYVAKIETSKRDAAEANRGVSKLQSILEKLEGEKSVLSNEIKSLLNPYVGFDNVQEKLRSQKKCISKKIHARLEQRNLAQNGLVQHTETAKALENELRKYNEIDPERLTLDIANLHVDLIDAKAKQGEIQKQKDALEVKLKPVIDEIVSKEDEKADTKKQISEAREYSRRLDHAPDGKTRKYIHRECAETLGTDKPGKAERQLIQKEESLTRKIEKLHARLREITKRHTLDVKKLIIDGNNLCYQNGDEFIGLAALKELLPILEQNYDVQTVFDASIRRLLHIGDTEIRKQLGGQNTYVTSTSTPADETILDLADKDSTTYVVSCDRYSEFPTSKAVCSGRVIRPQITGNTAMIHDLDVRVDFVI